MITIEMATPRDTMAMARLQNNLMNEAIADPMKSAKVAEKNGAGTSQRNFIFPGRH